MAEEQHTEVRRRHETMRRAKGVRGRGVQDGGDDGC